MASPAFFLRNSIICILSIGRKIFSNPQAWRESESEREQKLSHKMRPKKVINLGSLAQLHAQPQIMNL